MAILTKDTAKTQPQVSENKEEADFEAVKNEDGETIGYVYHNQRHRNNYTKLPSELFYEGKYLTVKAKWIYMALQSFTNAKTKKTNPGYKALMKRSGISRRADIAEALEELENFGWIIRARNFSKSNDYVIGLPCVVVEGRKIPRLSPTGEQAKNWKKWRSKSTSRFNEFLEKDGESRDDWEEEIFPF